MIKQGEWRLWLNDKEGGRGELVEMGGGENGGGGGKRGTWVGERGERGSVVGLMGGGVK